MVLSDWNRFSFLMIECVAVALSASFYQKEYSGYLITIAGFDYWESRTQDAAKTKCSENVSTLLAITNSSVQNAVVAVIKESVSQVSGNNLLTDGKRSNGAWTWINETSTAPLSIGGQSGGYTHSYAYLNTAANGFTLSASRPYDKNDMYYICEGQIFCTGGFEKSDQCFQSFTSESLSWYDARNRCLDRGGDLATFEFISSDNGLNTLNGSWLNPSAKYWIGLRREKWMWQSINSEVIYSQWLDGHPFYYNNPQCICLLPNQWKWSECQCDQQYQFVCLSSSGRTTRYTLTTTTSTTLRLITRSISPSTSMKSPSPPATIQHPTSNEGSSYNSNITSGQSVDIALAVGLGVGLGGGGGLLLTASVIVILLLLSRKGYLNCPSRGTTSKEPKPSPPPPPPPPDVIRLQSSDPTYAIILTNENPISTNGFSIAASTTATEYASLEIV